jgi:hypothetical protein
MTAINFWIVFILCRRELTVALGARRGHGGEHESSNQPIREQKTDC